MHYIRFLRAPKVSGKRGDVRIQLVFTITTDLGDSFLYPQSLFDLQVVAVAYSAGGSSTWLLSNPGHLDWEPGMRVAKPSLDLPVALQRAIQSGSKVHICVRATEPSHSAEGVPRILAMSSEKPRYRKEATEQGGVMPAWVVLTANGDAEVSTRRLQLSDAPDGLGTIEIEEEIGESIARHIWDGGVLATCAIAGIEAVPDNECSQHSCMKAMKDLFSRQKSIRVLELGCGVGILGVGLGAVYPHLHSSSPGECTILMTDLEEAEARARANIARLEQSRPQSEERPVRMLYENLDWEEGRLRKFGPQVQLQPWDLVMLSDCTYNVDMLPALVETLSAIHSNNLAHFPGGEPFTTKVFLATKPRHESENELFGLLEKEGWYTIHKQVVPLPFLGGEPQSVELFLFDKSGF